MRQATFRCPLPAEPASPAPPVSRAAGCPGTPQQPSEEVRRAREKRLLPGVVLSLPGWRGSSPGTAASGLPGRWGRAAAAPQHLPEPLPCPRSSSPRLRLPGRAAALGVSGQPGAAGSRAGLQPLRASWRWKEADGGIQSFPNP